MHHC